MHTMLRFFENVWSDWAPTCSQNVEDAEDAETDYEFVESVGDSADTHLTRPRHYRKSSRRGERRLRAEVRELPRSPTPKPAKLRRVHGRWQMQLQQHRGAHGWHHTRV
jgi:hypothetical protein